MSGDVNSSGDVIRPEISDADDTDLYQKALSHMQYRKMLEESRPEHCTFQPETGLSQDIRDNLTRKNDNVEVTQWVLIIR